ncbi:MAG: hypothetical protein Q8M58_12430, partial [Anaerolineales bacterium]|nr:hypothetical protein [Anaerolineales bacterium]
KPLLRNKCHCEERSSLLVTGDCFVAKNAPRNDRGYVSFAWNSGDFPLPKAYSVDLLAMTAETERYCSTNV